MNILDTRAAPQVENPQIFLYLVSNLIKLELVDSDPEGRMFSHDDLLNFLGATPKEIKQFKKTNLLPTSWLEKISQAEKGVELLESFDLEGYLSDSPHKSKRIDLGELPKNETPQKQKTEGHINSAKRIILRENGTERLSDDAIEKYLAGLEKLKSELNTDKGIGEIIADSKSPEGGNMNAASSIQTAGPKTTLGTATVTTQNKPSPTINVAKKVSFPEELREKFLEDLQSFLQVSKETFNYDFRREEQENFRETGILPPKRIELILKKEGGAAFLAGWEKDVTIEDFKPPLIGRGRKREEEFVPKDQAPHALYVIKQLTKKSNRELAGILGISINTFKAIPYKSARLHNRQVDYLADWLGIPRKEFSRRIKGEIPPKKTEKVVSDNHTADSEGTSTEVEVILKTLVTDYEKQQLNGDVTEKVKPLEQKQQELDKDHADKEKERTPERQDDGLSIREKTRGMTALFAEGIVRELSNVNRITKESVKERSETMTENNTDRKDPASEEGREKLKMEISMDFPKELPQIIEALILAADAAGGPSQEDQKGIFLGFLKGYLSGYVVTLSNKSDYKFVCFERKSDGNFFEFNISKLSYI